MGFSVLFIISIQSFGLGGNNRVITVFRKTVPVNMQNWTAGVLQSVAELKARD